MGSLLSDPADDHTLTELTPEAQHRVRVQIEDELLIWPGHVEMTAEAHGLWSVTFYVERQDGDLQ